MLVKWRVVLMRPQEIPRPGRLCAVEGYPEGYARWPTLPTLRLVCAMDEQGRLIAAFGPGWDGEQEHQYTHCMLIIFRR